jgi:hypothetical protein
MSWFKQTIERQRKALSRHLAAPMTRLARVCAAAWERGMELDGVLQDGLSSIPLCRLIYAVDTHGVQVSADIGPKGVVDGNRIGRDLSASPFLAGAVPCEGFLLSEVYVSPASGRPCITAVQVVHGDSRVLGFIAADFDLRDLPVLDRGFENRQAAWRQIKGDPAIRDGLFQQCRTKSAMDDGMDDVLAIMDELVCERGVFHCKLHFSSSRATLWLIDDPYNYRLHVMEEIIDPAVCLAYPVRPYSERATVPASLVRPVLERFRLLREADETVYLRSGSLNVINGMVGLTFSCDGSHYMPAREFLAKDDSFWFGAAKPAGQG